MKSLRHIFRFFRRNKYIFSINFTGVVLGLSSAVIILGIVAKEFQYDNWMDSSNEIFRVVQKTPDGFDPLSPKPLAPALMQNLPEVKQAGMVYSWYGYLSCNSAKKKLTEKRALFADSVFINLIDLPMVNEEQNSATLFRESVLLSESGAAKYFEAEDPIGKQLQIGDDRYFVITGVFKDFPIDSNFKGDIILDVSIIHHLTQVYFPDDWNVNAEGNTFVKLTDNSDPVETAHKIRELIASHRDEEIYDYQLQPLADIHINANIPWESGNQVNVTYLYFLLLVAIIVSFISLANFSMLYLSTTFKRQIGAKVRLYFGATRMQLFMDYLREILLLLVMVMVGIGVLILLYTEFLAKTVSYFPDYTPFINSGSWWIYTIIFFALLLIGIVIAYIMSSKRLMQFIKHDQPNMRFGFRFNQFLVVFQMAMVVILMVSTFVINEQVNYLINHDTGYQKDELITIPINMHVGHGFYNERLGPFTDQLKSHSGIRNVTLAFSSPASVETSMDEADWEGSDLNKAKFCWNSVFYNYFETLGVEVVEGRSFNLNFQNDMADYDKSFSNFILNETAVKAMGIEDPVGKPFGQHGHKGEIVGVVQDFHFRSLHEEIYPMVFNMNPFFYNEVIIRIDPDNVSVLDHIRSVWNEFVPEKAIEIQYVTDQLVRIYKQEEDLAQVLKTFSVIAIIISIFGLITLTISITSQRIKEIGIRKVNGATVAQILVLFNKDYSKWVMIGFVVACPLAWWAMSGWLNEFAYKTQMNPWLFAVAGAAILLLSIITITIQSFGAARRNPVDALKYE